MKLILLSLLLPMIAWAGPAQKELEKYLFQDASGTTDEGVQTDAVLIWKDGKVLLEKYARGYNKDSRHFIWSISKSVTGTLVGTALQQKKLKLSDPIKKYVSHPNMTGDKGNITVNQLMEWGSGFNWAESYEGDDMTKSSVVQMLYGKALFDLTGYFLAHRQQHRPGTQFYYSTGDSSFLMAILKEAFKGDANFPWTQLFDKIGMKSVTFEKDAKGVYFGGAYGHMTARDMLKIGQLYLNDGVWKGERLLPEGFVNYAWGGNETYKVSPNKTADWVQPGRQWWRNLSPLNPKKPAVNSLPTDAVFALGHWSQSLIIIPSMNLLAVRLGEDKPFNSKKPTFKFSEYSKRLMNFVQEAQ